MDSSNQETASRGEIYHLGVNKMGKNIKKSPLHQPNLASSARQQPQPQVYNINKNDFRNVVQQLTGSPSREPLHRPPQNHLKPLTSRLHKIRPPPLQPSRPHSPFPVPSLALPSVPPPYPNAFVRYPPPNQYDQTSQAVMLPSTPPDIWANTNESPISKYMRYLQNSIIDSGPQKSQSQPQVHGQNLIPSHSLPNPVMPQLPSPISNGPPPTFPSPRMIGPPPLIVSPHSNSLPPLPPHMMNGPPLLPYPTDPFLLPSPTGFTNLFSPRYPYPLLSPGYQHPPPISPNFSFSSVGQSGISGPVPHPPPSPGYGFPLSPSGFFPVSSPGWRYQ